MTLSELILLVHWEVQKSFNLVEELATTNNTADIVNIHLGLEKFEITIPMSINEKDMYYSTVNRMVEDERFRKFYYPLIIQSDKELKGKTKGITAKSKGKVLEVAVKSIVDEKLKTTERLGQMTITLTRVRS
jgi:hypothetical protein